MAHKLHSKACKLSQNSAKTSQNAQQMPQNTQKHANLRKKVMQKNHSQSCKKQLEQMATPASQTFCISVLC